MNVEPPGLAPFSSQPQSRLFHSGFWNNDLYGNPTCHQGQKRDKAWESLNSYSKPKSCLCLRAWMILTVLCNLSAQSKMILWAVSLLLENKSTCWWWGRGPCSLRSFPYPDAMPQVSRVGATQIWKHHPLIFFCGPMTRREVRWRICSRTNRPGRG